ncbi:hypothetical protein ACFQ6S_22910 [Streptomyces sp. NPDC056479]|uniref:hypothetical protein n=1 Tax=Streptomyces sp. NPDC056479 TaxID=3345832 RepID=UPI00368E2CA6
MWQARNELDVPAYLHECGIPGGTDLIEVVPGVLMPEAVEFGPGGVLGEDDLQFHLPVLGLPLRIITSAIPGDREQPPEGQRRLVVVPVPPTSFRDEAVAVVLGPLDPVHLDLAELAESVPALTQGAGFPSVVARMRTNTGPITETARAR